METAFHSLLIDGDRLAADFAARAEAEVRSHKAHNVHAQEEKTVMELAHALQGWQKRFQARTLEIALSDTAHYRRRMFPDYRAFSAITTKDSHLFGALLEYLRRNHSCLRYPGMESIDVLGVWSTSPYTGNQPRLAVTSNPNLEMIPGFGWDPRKTENRLQKSGGDQTASVGKEQQTAPDAVEDTGPVQTSRFLADLLFFQQALTGRPADNFEGCPEMNAQRAREVLQPFEKAVTLYRENYEGWAAGLWRAVVEEYTKAGKNEDDALYCARLARVCRYSDYDFEKKQIIPWHPPAL